MFTKRKKNERGRVVKSTPQSTYRRNPRQNEAVRDSKKMSFLLLAGILFAASAILFRQGYRFLSLLSFVGAITSILYITPLQFTYIPALLSIGFSVVATFFEMFGFFVKNKQI